MNIKVKETLETLLACLNSEADELQKAADYGRVCEPKLEAIRKQMSMLKETFQVSVGQAYDPSKFGFTADEVKKAGAAFQKGSKSELSMGIEDVWSALTYPEIHELAVTTPFSIGELKQCYGKCTDHREFIKVVEAAVECGVGLNVVLRVNKKLND